jgi:phage terminase large subunit-like protein
MTRNRTLLRNNRKALGARAEEAELLRRAEEELALRERIGGSFRAFVEYVQPKFIWYRHCEILAEVLEKVVTGEIKRLMVFMPPRHGKSEMVSRLFPAYCMYRDPEAWVAICSYAADLAYSLSRDSKDRYVRSGRPLDPDVSAKTNWKTTDGGEVWAAGVGGPITGKGFKIGIIDDPIKGYEEAMSPAVRRGQKTWYQSMFFNRLEPDGALVVMMTRWHEDDLAGWLLREEENEPQGWHLVNFEAIKSGDPFEVPKSCTLEEDVRLPGQALCPERFNEKRLASMRKTMSEPWWNALYQQRPSSMEGDIWKFDWFNEFTALPAGLHEDGFDWDLAYTENERNSACAYVRSSKDDLGNIYVTDASWGWKEFPEQIEWMTKLHGPHFIEAKASGKSATQTLLKNGIAAKEVKVQGKDKESRTRLASPVAQTGKVFLHKSVFDRMLYDERQGLMRFPHGSHDDLNDAFVQALNRHASVMFEVLFAE